VGDLAVALARDGTTDVRWVASNCGCGNPSETRRDFVRSDCTYFDMPQIRDFRSSNPLKRGLRRGVKNLLHHFRARRYGTLSAGSEVVHLQQMLHAYGSSVTFQWLHQRSAAARVVTVHEFDPEQSEFPDRSRAYNLADAIIVLSNQMRHDLIAVGVAAESIHVIPYGADIPDLDPRTRREAIVFYAGHRVMVDKGIRTMFESLAILAQRLGDRMPRLRVHGQYGDEPPSEALDLARRCGVAERIEWLNTIPLDRMSRLYQGSRLLVLPYAAGFAGLPSAVAAANALPIVATQQAAIPDHIGDCGVWIRGGDPIELADRIGELLADERSCDERGLRLRGHAQRHLAWDVIASDTRNVYRLGRERAARRSS
jgi:glycosyltransferase involved in cell wall biosynthesis